MHEGSWAKSLVLNAPEFLSNCHDIGGKIAKFFFSFKEACAVSPHKGRGIRRLLPALITPGKTALREKTALATITPHCETSERRSFKIHISKTKMTMY